MSITERSRHEPSGRIRVYSYDPARRRPRRHPLSPASALIDEALGIAGSQLIVLTGHTHADIEVLFENASCHGEPVTWGQDYALNYFPIDERVPRFLRLPDRHIAHCLTLLTPQELSTSPTYNELLVRSGAQNGLVIRLDGPDHSHIAWALTDPRSSDGWGAETLTFINALLPHLRQFVRVRQAFARAEARSLHLTHLLDTTPFGLLCLDRRGRIVEANARAQDLLQHGDGVRDLGGYLHAARPDDNHRLQRLLARALPRYGRVATGGSLTLRRPAAQLPLTVHITPVDHRADFGATRVAVLVLLLAPDQRPQIDPATVAQSLGLTPAESRIAAAIAQGYMVKDIANRTYRSQATVRGHLKQIHAKLGLSRQADLVRLVLTTAGLPHLDA